MLANQPISIQAISAFNDNYIWIMTHAESAVVVDPGDATPVLKYLQDHHLSLRAILVTHHHGDHVGGVKDLVKAYACPVYGPYNPKLDMIDQRVREGDSVPLGQLLQAEHKPSAPASTTESGQMSHGLGLGGQELKLQVLEVPGHTLDHIAYTGVINDQQAILFCGDTLFSCGSGRIFEGNSRMMLQSLDKFKKMPENTLIYCAHEYTLSNIKWAMAVESDNKAIQQWHEQAVQLRAEDRPTIPTNLGQELRTNPFLRVNEPSVRQAAQQFAGQELETPAEVLGALREWKNTF